MPAKKYRVRLSAVEQQELKGLVSRGRVAAYKQTHARILLLPMYPRPVPTWFVLIIPVGHFLAAPVVYLVAGLVSCKRRR